MCQENLKINKLFNLTVLILLICALFQPAVGQDFQRVQKSEKIKGRVFAAINSLTSGAGVGPKFQTFIFEEIEPKKSNDKMRFLRIVYEYFHHNNRLDSSFYDYQVFYEVKLIRKVSCDQKLSEFAYEQNGDSNPPTSILNILPGANKELLSEDHVLPCYVLSELNYKKLAI